MTTAAHVLIQLSHGFHMRQMFTSGVASTLLSAGCRVTAVAPNADEEYLTGELERLSVGAKQMPDGASPAEQLLANLRPFLLRGEDQDGTFDVKWERYRRQNPWRARGVDAMRPAFRRSARLRQSFRTAEQRLFAGAEYDSLLREVDPSLVVTGTPGFDLRDAHLLRAAHRAGYPTASVVLSWDNLTTRGEMSPAPHHVLVWNDLMRDEAVGMHGVPEERVHVVGAPQFDHYAGADRVERRAAFLRRHGLAENTRLIAWGTINESVLPGQFDVLRDYVARHHDPGSGEHLWVRVHPQSVRGSYARNRPMYERLAGESVTVELPPVRSERLSWDLDPSDVSHLADLLCAASVLVTPQSTLVLDGVCLDTPVVALAIGTEARKLYEYRHFRPVLDLDAVDVVHSLRGLRRAIEEAVERPDRLRVQRGLLREAEMGPCFGIAAQTCASRLAELAGAAAARRPAGVSP